MFDAAMSLKTNQIMLQKAIVSSCIGANSELLNESMEHFSRWTGYKLEKTLAKISVHSWNIRKGASIGFKVLLRKQLALQNLKLIKSSRLLGKNPKVSNGSITVGIPVYHQIKSIEFNPTVSSYGLQVTYVFSYVGSTVAKRKRSKCKVQRKVTSEQVYNFINKS